MIRALHGLDARADLAAFIGESKTDVTNAHAAHVRSIGYANKTGKPERLARAGAHVIVTAMRDLALAIREA